LLAGQPVFRLLEQPDPSAEEIFVFFPALFISQAAKLSGLECDQSRVSKPFHDIPVWRLKLEKDQRFYEKKENLRLEISLCETVAGEYDWYMLTVLTNSGTPTMARTLAILGRNQICFIPIICFLIRHRWAPVRNHSFYDITTEKWSSKNTDWFCSWTPQNGYTNHSRIHNRTIVRLDNGSHYWTLSDFIAKVNEWRVPVPVPEPTLPANPTAGITVTNRHGATMKYRADDKWQCTNCNACFVHGTLPAHQRLILEHKGYGQLGKHGSRAGRQCQKK